MVSDDVICQLQVMFPWVSVDEIENMGSNNQGGCEGHGTGGGGGPAAGGVQDKKR